MGYKNRTKSSTTTNTNSFHLAPKVRIRMGVSRQMALDAMMWLVTYQYNFKNDEDLLATFGILWDRILFKLDNVNTYLLDGRSDLDSTVYLESRETLLSVRLHDVLGAKMFYIKPSYLYPRCAISPHIKNSIEKVYAFSRSAGAMVPFSAKFFEPKDFTGKLPRVLHELMLGETDHFIDNEVSINVFINFYTTAEFIKDALRWFSEANAKRKNDSIVVTFAHQMELITMELGNIDMSLYNLSRRNKVIMFPSAKWSTGSTANALTPKMRIERRHVSSGNATVSALLDSVFVDQVIDCEALER